MCRPRERNPRQFIFTFNALNALKPLLPDPLKTPPESGLSQPCQMTSRPIEKASSTLSTLSTLSTCEPEITRTIRRQALEAPPPLRVQALKALNFTLSRPRSPQHSALTRSNSSYTSCVRCGGPECVAVKPSKPSTFRFHALTIFIYSSCIRRGGPTRVALTPSKP
jgi:hypothetical protein